MDPSKVTAGRWLEPRCIAIQAKGWAIAAPTLTAFLLAISAWLAPKPAANIPSTWWGYALAVIFPVAAAVILAFFAFVKAFADRGEKRLKAEEKAAIDKERADLDKVILYQYFFISVQGVVTTKVNHLCQKWREWKLNKKNTAKAKAALMRCLNDTRAQMYAISQAIYSFFCQGSTDGKTELPIVPGFSLKVYIWQIQKDGQNEFRVSNFRGQFPVDETRRPPIELLNKNTSSARTLLQDRGLLDSGEPILVLPDLANEIGKRYIPSPGETPESLKGVSMLLYAVKNHEGEPSFLITVKLNLQHESAFAEEKATIYASYLKKFGERVLIEDITGLAKAAAGYSPAEPQAPKGTPVNKVPVSDASKAILAGG